MHQRRFAVFFADRFVLEYLSLAAAPPSRIIGLGPFSFFRPAPKDPRIRVEVAIKSRTVLYYNEYMSVIENAVISKNPVNVKNNIFYSRKFSLLSTPYG